MRALDKTPPPQVLRDNHSKWREEYIASGGSTKPWNRKEIKDALKVETSEKCAYCEARFLAVSFGDIEHILPKSKFPRLVVDWNNLTLACGKCNQHKGAKYDPELPFVNPYIDDVEEHILFLGAIAYSVSERGDYSIGVLKLNDAGRVESRERELGALESLLRRLEGASSEFAKRQLSELIELQAATGQYTAAIRSYLALRKRPILESEPAV